LPLSTWVESLWQQQVADALLLNPWQELALWETAGANQSASTALKAYQTLLLWEVPLTLVAEQANEEVDNFLGWLSHTQEICQQRQWCLQAELAQRLSKHLLQFPLTFSAVYLLGFDELPPAHARIIDQLGQRAKVISLQSTTNAANAQRALYPDSSSELRAMAEWAKQRAIENAGAKIACVVPKLAERRPSIVRQFSETLDPHQIRFNLSAGKPLLQYPLVHSALKALSLMNDTIAYEDLSYLLTSPYLQQSEQDAYFAAMIDLAARQLNEQHLSKQSLVDLMQKHHFILAKTSWLSRMLSILHLSYTLHSATEWAQYFIDCLQQLGWPGSRDIDSMEHQLIERFKQLLAEFSTLELVHESLDWQSAVTLITRLAKQTEFQPEGSEGTVQVLGVLEAGGCQFDSLWVMGLDDESWPVAAKPNPFIPHAIQRRYGLPHADAARELRYSEQTTQRLLQSAPTVIFSHAMREGDRELRPSPLITQYPLLDLPPAAESPIISCALEPWQDQQAPPLDASENISQSSHIITLQSACPFRAFAEIRLKANAAPYPVLGLGSRTRGTLVHATLEHLWQRLGNSDALHALSSHELLALVTEVIQQVMQQHSQQRQYYSETTQHWLALESQRLLPLLLDWLTLEKSRPPFQVVAQEEEFRLNIGALNFKVRVDRIDELANGASVIIDYKTSQQSASDWSGERPRQPQLLLYFFTGEKHYAGITFAEVIRGKPALKGLWQAQIATPMTEFQGIIKKDDWDQQREQWQQCVTSLAEEFLQGIATVSPAEASTCRFCHLPALCRIQQLSTDEPDND